MSGASRAWSWRHAFASSSLPAMTKHVLHTLGMFMNELGEGCFPSVADICSYSGLDKKTVLKHLAVARESGWIAVSQHGYRGQKWKRNEYAARWPERDLTAACPPDDSQGGGAVPPPSDGSKVVESVPEGGGNEGSKVVEQLHQDKTSPVTTPKTSPKEREREREDLEESELVPVSIDDPKKFEQRVKRLAGLGWPRWDKSSTKWTVRQFAELSDQERHEAETFAEAYLRRNGKGALSLGTYFVERKWLDLPPEAVPRESKAVEANAFGKWFMARRFVLLFAGATVAPKLTSFEQIQVDSGAWDLDTVMREKRMKIGWPAVNALHDKASHGASITVSAELQPLADMMETVHVGSALWNAWKAEHEARGWPWLPDPGKHEWVSFPAGGPIDGLAKFEQAMRDLT